MDINKTRYSTEITAKQIDEAIDIVRQLMNISLDMAKLTLYRGCGIGINEQETGNSETTELSK